MIKRFIDKFRETAHSLYVGLFLTILLGALLGVATYTLVRLSANSAINNHYLSETEKEKREQAHIDALQEYITVNGLTSADMKKISKWAQSNRYVYLILYKDDQLFFTSDMIIPDDVPDSENNGESADSGTTDSEGGSSGADGEISGDGSSGGSGDENTGDGGSDGANDGSGDTDGDQSGADDEGTDEGLGDGQGSSGDGQGSSGDGQGSSGDGQGTSGGSQSGSGDGQGTSGGSQSGSGNQGGSGGSGITIDYPTREELKEYAQNNDQYVIEVGDGMLLASIAEFSEYLYYDLSNIMSLVLAMIVLAFVIVNYFRRIVARIKRLETDVTIVTHGDMTHKIHSKGYDEISILSSNVDNMRNSILENLRKEREARDANTELITAMSHDIRTPLTVLLGYIEMMKSEADGDGAMGEYLNATERTAMRLKQLSDDMFKYSLAFGDAAERVVLEEYDGKMLMEQMLSEHILLLREKGYEVVTGEKDDVPEGVRVYTDAQNLMRIIDNVFSNLQKYADEEQPVVINLYFDGESQIVLQTFNAPKKIVTKVESNGIGMKTCKRLANFIAESFEYGERGGKYFTRLALKAKFSDKNEEEVF